MIETTRTSASRRNPAPDPYETSTVVDIHVSTPAEGVKVLRVVGDIDMLTAPVVDSMVTAQLGAGLRRFVLDLRDVGFMSSAGLASLLAARERAAEVDVALIVVAATDPVLRPLQVTGLNALLDLRTTMDGLLAT